MRLRRAPNAIPLTDNHALVVTEQKAYGLPGCWRQIFAADNAGNPLFLEIGMGRGDFLSAAAASYPGHNYLGLERRAEPLTWLLKGLAMPYPPNLRIIRAEAARLAQMFAPRELSMIYLFFPDPWPKSRHAKRRLTAPAFIEAYQRILEPAGSLVFKTDGAAFYHWSCANFMGAGWRMAQGSEDWPLVAGEGISGYEQRFRALGQPIYYAQILPPCR